MIPARQAVLRTLFCALLVCTAQGAILYDTLEPHCCGGENIGPAPGTTLRHADGFQAAETFELTSISFNLIESTGGPGSFVVDIFNDSGGTFHTPASLVASYTVAFPPALDLAGFPSVIFTAVAPAGIVLDAGHIYWISPWSTGGAWASWWLNSESIGLRSATPIGTGDWFSACGATNSCGPLGMRVEGNIVPEPSTASLLIVAAVIGLAVRRLA